MAAASLDANLVLRWLLDDVPAQTARVQRLLDTGVALRLADVALVEVTYVLERVLRLSRGLVADYVEAVLALGTVEVDRATWHSAVSAYRSHPKLSIADCFLAADAAATGSTPLYTFDATLARQLSEAELPPR
ncbi:PIN domain-containing protein [Nocardioides sp.]|uniref:PIN domain-containing protein n=1 Tax=Nocardioides sp. TaxID=35761 RepID=UPI0039E2D448